MVELYDVISAGYKDPKHQKNTLAKHGFIRDDSLSSHNNQVYYNPTQKKVIYNTTGTHNLKDWGTNFYLGAGHLKNTTRYKEAHKGIRDAKTKYQGYNVMATGDSLGGAITRGIASKGDKIYTLNSASTIGQKTRTGENNFRVNHDPVSILNANSKHMKTIKNQNMITPSKLLNGYLAHVPSSIKHSGIKII